MTVKAFVSLLRYADITFADSYVAERDNTSWLLLDEATKNKYLAIATQYIDGLNFVGYKTVPTQVNQFPRGGDTEYPMNVSKACCLLAYDMGDGEFEPNDDGVQKEEIGDAKWTYYDHRSGDTFEFPNKEAFILLAPFILDPRRIDILRA